jgi:transposase
MAESLNPVHVFQEVPPMMGTKLVEPKLYLSFSLDAAVPRNHLVRRLAAVVDFQFVRGLVRKHYSHTGQPSVDPVVLFKLWLLGYLFNLTSERRLCEEASLNLAWRWFLGYELDQVLPDHSVLSKARRRFGIRVYEQFFARIVQLCEHAGLVQGDVLFVDSTLTQANASAQGLRSRALAQHRLARPADFVAGLWTVNDEEHGDDDDPTDPKWRPAKDRSGVNHLCVSPVDPDAQMFKKYGTTPLLTHKTHFVVDGGRAGVITAVQVTGSCQPDCHAVGKLLDKHQVAVGRQARQLVGDRGYGSEDAMLDCLARDVEPWLGRRTGGTNKHGGFDRDRFSYIPAKDLYICPAGKELRRFRFKPDRPAEYRARQGTCQQCHLRLQCLGMAGRSNRVIRRSHHIELVEAMQARLSSRRGRQLLHKRHVLSERINADAKTKHGMARAQFRGRGKMQMQALLTAAVINLKHLVKRMPEAQEGVAALRPLFQRPTRTRSFAFSGFAIVRLRLSPS